MRFGDYLKTIKGHFIESISNEDLCLLLFDSIIIPLDLKTTSGDPLGYSKGRISEFISGKAPIPKSIRDGFFDKRVTSTIAGYFEINIANRLAPELDDLCYQMMELIDCDTSISPTSKSNLRLLASSKSIDLFLVQCFGYALRNEDPNLYDKPLIIENENSITAPNLSLAGIINGDVIEGSFSTDNFEIISSDYKDALIRKIKNLYSKALSISVPRVSSNIGSFNYYLSSEKVSLNQESMKGIRMIAESLSIDLPDDFFYLGNLRNNKLKSAMSVYGGSSLEGTDAEKFKYRTIKQLEKTIDEVLCLISIDGQFKEYKAVALAICNNGTQADQTISVSITIPKDSYVTIDELLKINVQTLDDVLYERSEDRIFYIKRTAAVLDYDESVRNKRFHPLTRPSLPFESYRDKTEDYRRELKEIFPYYVNIDGDSITLTAEFDEVLHHTNVAFPSVILLNSDIETIEYTIRSRNMPSVVKGSLQHH